MRALEAVGDVASVFFVPVVEGARGGVFRAAVVVIGAGGEVGFRATHGEHGFVMVVVVVVWKVCRA